MSSFMDHLISCQVNSDDQEALFHLLTDELKDFPKYVMEMAPSKDTFYELNDAFIRSNIWKRDILTLLYLDSILFNIFQMYDCDDYRGLKRCIVAFNASLLRFKSRIPSDDFQNLIIVYSRELSEIVPQCGNETNVITGCCPIVPYIGVVKKPFIGERELTDEELRRMLSPVTESTITVVNPDATRTEVIKHMIELIYHDRLFMMFLMRNAGIFQETTDAAHLMDMTRGVLVDTVDGMTKKLYAYYLYAAIYKYAEQYGAMESSIRGIYADIDAFLSKDFKSYLAGIESALPATEELLLYELENGSSAAEFMKKPDENDKSGDIDPLKLFNFDDLMNYIYVNRRFRANHYTNSAFMNMSVIGGYIFYKGFLIIRPKTSDDQELNYLYIPVIDDLNGSQVRIIKFYRDSRIEILTEPEYAKDINEG